MIAMMQPPAFESAKLRFFIKCLIIFPPKYFTQAPIYCSNLMYADFWNYRLWFHRCLMYELFTQYTRNNNAYCNKRDGVIFQSKVARSIV